MLSAAHHCVLPPVRQAVVHSYLLPFRNVADRYDNQSDLSTTVDFSNPAIGRRVEEHGSSNTARSLFPQLRNAGKTRSGFSNETASVSIGEKWSGSSLPELSGVRQVVGTTRRRKAVFGAFWVLAVTCDQVNGFIIEAMFGMEGITQHNE